jgi:UMF1 family MFS transporter
LTLDDRLGSKPTIIAALIGLIGCSILAVTTTSLVLFWLAGAGIGLFVGPVQAASRSLMARLAPADRQAAFFGLFALSGRATAFLGPAIVAVATSASGNQRVGLATIVGLFAIGLMLILPVSEPRGKPRAAARA